MEIYLAIIAFAGAAIALIFAVAQRGKVMQASEGNARMVKLAQAIREGANAYLKRQYSTVAKVFAVVFVVLLAIAFLSKGQMLSRVTPFAFLTGGIWSMLAGLVVCYAIGTIWFMVVYSSANGSVGLGVVLGWCVIPFIIPDLVKIALAFVLSR